MTNKLSIPKKLLRFSRVFEDHGFECHLVGGAVRDLILRRKLTDYDIATDATPEQIKGMFRRVIPTGITHGTVTIIFEGSTIEVTTFRADGEYTDGRRPDSIQ